MKLTSACWLVLAAWALAVPGWASAEAARELTVHLAQANNDSPYAFVRAKFNPGEVTDPWAVRFVDARGNEVPSFVWDSITWRVACKGRADWGQRYALLNHAAGDAPQVREARGQKLLWAGKNLPDLGAGLQAADGLAGEDNREAARDGAKFERQSRQDDRGRSVILEYARRAAGMRPAEWLGCDHLEKMAQFLRASGAASDRKLRLFACACCRRVWHLLTDERSQHAVEVAERYADGCAREEERFTAWEAASDAGLAGEADAANAAEAAVRGCDESDFALEAAFEAANALAHAASRAARDSILAHSHVGEHGFYSDEDSAVHNDALR